MEKGRIIKLIGGQYTVLLEDGNRRIVKPRGKFRHVEVSPKVGDLVVIEGETITEVKPRFNELKRPPIVNVDTAFIINAIVEPNFSFNLLDRFLVMVAYESIEPVIVVSKIDLADDDTLQSLKQTLNYYENYYDILYTSVKKASTLDVLRGRLKNRISVFAGQTGSGKSSLLNALDERLNIKTGTISKALGRGRHTTRHSELIHVDGGLVADTPGFSKLDFDAIDCNHLPELYPDFFALSSHCKFRGCHHLNEPKCAVKAAVENGDIPSVRYENYKLIYEAIKSIKPLY